MAIRKKTIWIAIPAKWVLVISFCISMLVVPIRGYCATPFVNEDAWRFEISPYIWALQMDGRVQVGKRAAHVDLTFSDIVQKMDFGGMIWMDAHKGKFDLFVNGLYAVLSSDAHDGPYSVNVKDRFGIFSAGAGYVVYKSHAITIDPYVGARYTRNNTRVTFNTPTLSLTSKLDENWTDPIVGVRLRYDLTKAWQIWLLGDVGGVNTSSQYSYNAIGLIGYNPQTILTNTTAYIGYHLLDQHYVTGSGANYYNWNMKLYGPVLGVAFSF